MKHMIYRSPLAALVRLYEVLISICQRRIVFTFQKQVLVIQGSFLARMSRIYMVDPSKACGWTRLVVYT
jgi:hypothetical protein